MGLVRLQERRCQPELMDEPGLDPERHRQALQGLARINWLSASDRILWHPIRALARELAGKPLRVLDIATGGGDVPIRLWQRARSANLNVHFDGGDISPTALEVARQNAARQKADVSFFSLDVHKDGVPSGYDVVMCSLFLHHQNEEQVLTLLRGMKAAAGSLVLVNDLRRSAVGFALAWLGARLLTTSRVVHVDGPRSVEAAFSLQEVRTLANRTGMEDAIIGPRWPCRFLLAWRRP